MTPENETLKTTVLPNGVVRVWSLSRRSYNVGTAYYSDWRDQWEIAAQDTLGDTVRCYDYSLYGRTREAVLDKWLALGAEPELGKVRVTLDKERRGQ